MKNGSNVIIVKKFKYRIFLEPPSQNGSSSVLCNYYFLAKICVLSFKYEISNYEN
jgi:hypothetical protein